MDKINYNIEDILNKEFNIEFKGYSSSEVDAFLDLILEDYESYNEKINEYKNECLNLQLEITSLKAQLLELEASKKFDDEKTTDTNSSIDLVKRVSRLEEAVFKNNI